MHAKNLAGFYGLPTMKCGRSRRASNAACRKQRGAGGPNRHTCWLATINADGSPHVNGVGVGGGTMAGTRRPERNRADRSFQRALGRSTSVARLPHRHRPGDGAATKNLERLRDELTATFNAVNVLVASTSF